MEPRSLTTAQYAGREAVKTQCVREETAAQSAHRCAEEALGQARSLLSRLESLADRLGNPSLNTDASCTPKPVRAGIIGAFTEVTEQASATLNDAHSVMSRIENQI